MKIKFVGNDFMPNMARCIPEQHLILVNWDKIQHLTDFQQLFIILHEAGHIQLNTSNEFEADKFAFNKLAGSEKYSLKQLIEGLKQTLPFTTDEQKERVNAIAYLALSYVAEKEGSSPEIEELMLRLKCKESIV